MKNCEGKVSSIFNGSALDGPGIRCVVFMAGCNLRCPYCHNPETLYAETAETYTAEGLFKRILRYKNYISNGGVTFSGGEPFLQAEFCRQVALMCKKEGIHTAAETNGTIADKGLIAALDLIIADVKNQYGDYLPKLKEFLDECKAQNKSVMLTNVIVKGANDIDEKLSRIKDIVKNYPNIIKVKFLPFKNYCAAKYQKLNIDFPYKDKENTTEDYIKEINSRFDI
jgi:pyruvate formate lyase activating enzyme